MIELTIHGRGGQGGVTLAKLIAQTYFLRGQHAQAFGVYAAERSGAPLQAYVRVDEEEITNHNQIRAPDHVIVLDRTLIGPSVISGLKPDGWIMLNASTGVEAFQEMFPGRRVAVVDATTIAIDHGLGTRAVPIVNTTMLGAVARMLGLTFDDVCAALESLRFVEGNVSAAQEAFNGVVAKELPGERLLPASMTASTSAASMFDEDVGSLPKIRTGAWATRQPHRRRLTPPCNHACPSGNDVQAFVAAAADEDYDSALAILLKTSPLPGVCGRVCPAPCMDNCNRATYDECVNVRELERYVSDHGKRELLDRRPWNDLAVAVVGSGPAGLSSAYQLARLGYAVTIFEVGKELGGVMRTGIPSYRLPRDVLDAEINYILDQGIEARTGHSVDRKELLRLSRDYAAVFIATGLQESRSLNLAPPQGGSVDRVVQGIDFLDRVRNGTVSVRGEHILVVGGGNTAIDAARSARRLGARDVHIVYRRTRREMPAVPEEIEAAVEEGIQIDELVSPTHLQLNGSAPCLTCQRMRLSDPDESGRARPIPEVSEDAYFDLRCDRVILALGQTPDLSILPEGAELQQNDSLLGLTDAPIFFGGDFSTNGGTVSAAIGSGRMAALHIHRMLTGEDFFPPPMEPVAGPEEIQTYVFSYSPRKKGIMLAPSIRKWSFTEVHRGFSSGATGHYTAALEAKRCFSCGVCNECDRCVTYCPEGILMHNTDGYRFDYDYCKGCGICASQCPRGVIYMAEL